MQQKSPLDEGHVWRAKKIIIHAKDVCGLMNTTSIIGARFFLLFVNDYSRKMWVYLKKLKSNVPNEFQKFKALVQKESSCYNTTLRSNNGKELCSKEFHNFCAKHGIKRQFTKPWTPRQNGVIERQNHTITKRARCMMEYRCVPNRFWVEAMFTTIYMMNRYPTMEMKQNTPEEELSKRNPKVNHRKVFGSIACAFILDEKRTKIDSKSKKQKIKIFSRDQNYCRVACYG
jgi:transposase InsO family protein